MKKERIMAIIGIVLPFICYCLTATIYDPVSGHYVPTIQRVGAEPYPEELQNQIWVKTLIIIFVLFFYQIFFYVAYLTESVKVKRKSLVIFSIIGLGLSIGLLISGFGSGEAHFSLISIPYLIIFSIVMLVRSFKKHKNN